MPRDPTPPTAREGSQPSTRERLQPNARERLLDTALTLIRAKGYAATTVDDLCTAAGVTKGAFFHHFRSKDDLGAAAADHWAAVTARLFADAPYHQPTDPLARVLAYIDFRQALIDGPIAAFTCLAGTMAQECFDSSPAIRDACGRAITGHAATLEADIQAARDQHGLEGAWTAQSLALHTQAVLQGAFILAKATGDATQARETVAHLRRYIALLFSQPSEKEPIT